MNRFLWLCLALLALAPQVPASDDVVFFDGGDAAFTPLSISFKSGRPLEDAPESPAPWRIYCWHIKTSALFEAGPDPVTRTNAYSLLNLEGMPSIVMSLLQPHTIAPFARYALSVDYLTTGTGAGMMKFVMPQMPHETLPNTAGTWQRHTLEFESGDSENFLFDLRCTQSGRDNGLYIKRIALTRRPDEPEAPPPAQ